MIDVLKKDNTLATSEFAKLEPNDVARTSAHQILENVASKSQLSRSTIASAGQLKESGCAFFPGSNKLGPLLRSDPMFHVP